MKLKILLTLITLLSANSTLAHHSFSAEFDIDKPVSLSGKVTKMQWSNPHGWIYIDVENADGSMTNWALETSAANNLIRRGWKRDHLVAGTVIQVQGFQARNGSATANIRGIVLEDGTRLFSGNADELTK
jgi:DNA/RNA endonuclease YhcR with UshA esterase domain